MSTFFDHFKSDRDLTWDASERFSHEFPSTVVSSFPSAQSKNSIGFSLLGHWILKNQQN